MKILYAFLLLAFCGQLSLMPTVQGQPRPKDVDIIWGNKQRASKRTTLSDVVGYDETGIYALKTISKGLYGMSSYLALEQYDHEMNQTRSVEIELEHQKKSLSLEFVLQYNRELYLFSSFKDQKEKRNLLYVQQVNKKSLKPEGMPREIASISYEGEKKKNSGNFGYSLSGDSTKMLVFYSLPHSKKEYERFGFHVFDQDLKEIWTKEITLPYEEQLYEVERYKVDNAGNVHLLGMIFHEKRKEKRKGEVNYLYQVLSYRNQGNSLTEYPVEIPSKFLNDMQIAITPEQDIICAGFYSEEGTKSIRGSYFVKIDGRTKELKRKSFREFSADFITRHMSERQADKARKKIEKGKNVEMYKYALDELVIREDGGVILIGEQYYINTYTFNSMGPNGMMNHRTVTYYNYNDIIVININPEGAIEWEQKIPKVQSTKEDGGFFSSYVMALVEDKLFFVFNDNPKNLFPQPGKRYNFNPGKKQSTVMLVTMDRNGRQKKAPLFMTGDADVVIRPIVCEQISGTELVVFGQRKKNQRFAKLRFKEAAIYGSVKEK